MLFRSLLLFSKLPDEKELAEFTELLASLRRLPTNFVRDVIMKASGKDIMNSMTRSVLTLGSYDDTLNDTSLSNVLRQCLMLISEFPMLAVYGYRAYSHYERNKSLYIHRPDMSLSTAENILRMLRPDKKFTKLEALVLDIALVLHMEHGGGNNSTFTTRVVTSSGSDTYSVMAAALCSLKGPKHGGANIKVQQMMKDLKKHVKDTSDVDEIVFYLSQLLNKEAFDKKGLIYGMGHAVYSVSDPRAQIFKGFVKDLAEEKGLAVQSSVREGGGNNGAIINTALDGIPVIVVGVPVRYIHSHYGITSYYDFEATVQLATEVVRSMTEEIIRSF